MFQFSAKQDTRWTVSTSISTQVATWARAPRTPDFGRGSTSEMSSLNTVQAMHAVICLAALSNDPVSHLNPAATYSINLDGTLRLGRSAKRPASERFLFASSCSLYGAAGSQAVTEEAEMSPVTPYGETKAMAEQELALLADDSFSPTYLRNATAYGFSPRLRLDIVVNNLTAVAMTTGEVSLESDGSPWRPLVHVEDISRSFLAMLEAPREVVHNEAFNVGRDHGQCPGPRHRRDRPPGHPEFEGHAGRHGRSGPARLPSRFLEVDVHVPGSESPLECSRRSGRARRRLYRIRSQLRRLHLLDLCEAAAGSRALGRRPHR